MNNYYLYFHKNSQTKELFYVGLGTDNRSNDFKSGRTQHYKNYIKKYGNPIVELIHENLDLKQACFYEIYYIALYGRIGYESWGILVNKSEGGEGGALGLKHSKLTIELRSQKLRGKKKPESFCQNLSKIHKGKIVSKETIRKILEKRDLKKDEMYLKRKDTLLSNPEIEIKRAKNISKGRCKPVLQLDQNKNIFKEYSSKNEAEKLTGIKTIVNYINKDKILHGYYWKYKDHEIWKHKS